MTETADRQPILAVRNLRKTFRLRNAGNPFQRMVVPAVDDVSFEIARGETVALVGESGSGKSTLARVVLKLHEPDAGTVTLLGTDVHDLSERAFRRHRRHVQMVFQNPLASFDPLRTIGSAITDALELTERDASRREELAAELLVQVGLSPRFMRLRPRAVSGGELQRASIARAIATKPDLLALDEPTSALDMSIRGQVLTLLQQLQEERGLGYLLVTHDLRTVELLAHRVMVMYLGQIVETATVEELFREPLHPYTVALLAASELAERGAEGDVRSAVKLEGSLRYPQAGDVGCRLRERCPRASAGCERPQELIELRPGRWVRCWRAADVGPMAAQAERSAA